MNPLLVVEVAFTEISLMRLCNAMSLPLVNFNQHQHSLWVLTLDRCLIVGFEIVAMFSFVINYATPVSRVCNKLCVEVYSLIRILK
jgi:hypothetical protein